MGLSAFEGVCVCVYMCTHLPPCVGHSGWVSSYLWMGLVCISPLYSFSPGISLTIGATHIFPPSASSWPAEPWPTSLPSNLTSPGGNRAACRLPMPLAGLQTGAGSPLQAPNASCWPPDWCGLSGLLFAGVLGPRPPGDWLSGCLPA